MTKKEYLSQAYVLNRKIEQKERRIDTLRASLGVSASNPDEVRVKSEPHSPFESMLMIIIDLEREVEKEKEELENLKMEIWNVLRSIGDNLVESVMEMRYLGFLSWNDISRKMGYSLDYCYYLHRHGMSLVRV